MKKSKNVIGKMLFIISLMVIVSFFIGGTPPKINASNEGVARNTMTHLINENMELKREYSELMEKLKKMEETTQEIYEYDNMLYAQILGVDFDTTDFSKYRNDSATIILNLHDSIFKFVDNRAFYVSEMLALQLKKLQATSHRFKNNKNAILYYPTLSPIKTSEFIELSSPYGWRMHPIDKKMLYHEGVDIAATVGTPIHATAQGRVIKILYSKYGYGNRVVIQHAYGFETLYAHMSLIKVKKGQWVNKNQIIGTVGNTGRSTGSHLHYEIHKYGEPRDPLGYFYTNITDEYLASK